MAYETSWAVHGRIPKVSREKCTRIFLVKASVVFREISCYILEP